MLLGAFQTHPWAAGFATTAAIWSVVYMLWMFQRVMYGKLDKPENQILPDWTLGEKWALVPLVILIFVLGIAATPVLNKLNPSVTPSWRRPKPPAYQYADPFAHPAATAQTACAADPRSRPAERQALNDTFVHAQDLFTISPMLSVMILGMVVLMVDLGLPRDRKSPLVAVSLIGLLVAGVLLRAAVGRGTSVPSRRTIVADDFALIFQFILLVVAALSIALSEKYIQTKGINYGEYYALMLFSTSGAMLMATSRELITIFVGLEILSIALYVLSGFARTEARSEESAMKYFLLGSFSSGFFLYGIALVYGGTGTTRLDAAVASLPMAALASHYTVAGFALLIVGLGFKAAIVPFHSWTPDVYEGAPTSVTAFMSAGAKAGAFAAFIRVASALLPLSQTYPALYGGFADVLWMLAILTMIVGNVLAVVQTNIKRMLAYSSIAHAGLHPGRPARAEPEGPRGDPVLRPGLHVYEPGRVRRHDPAGAARR